MRKLPSILLSVIILLYSFVLCINCNTTSAEQGFPKIFVETENINKLKDGTSNANKIYTGKGEIERGKMNPWKDFAQKTNTTRLVVRFNGGTTFNPESFKEVLFRYSAEIVNTVSFGSRSDAVVFELPSVYAPSFMEELEAYGVSYIEPSMLLRALFVPNDPYWHLQWGPKKIMADWAWNTTIGSSEILVAVVDTGIYYYHEDIWINYVPYGYDWVNNDPVPLDDHGHGTHCAGIIAAVLNNYLGISGLAQVSIMAEKVLDYSGSGYADWVANGIIHATNCGAKIISLSLGGYGYSQILHEAVKYAYKHGVLLVAAAGNDNTNMKLYPAAFEEVVAVSATDQNDYRAWFSNWGEWIELSAPGVNILSTVPWGYYYASGTSMAAPHVAGVAALTWSQHPSKSREWIRLWLRQTADDLGPSGYDVYYGYGRINARKAVEQTPPTHELIAYNMEAPPYVEPGTTALINATLLNFGVSDETNVIVSLIANKTTVSLKTIEYLAAGSEVEVSLPWNPIYGGLYNLTVYINPVQGEQNTMNNWISKLVYVGYPVKAVVLHSAGNVIGEIITNWQVLTNEWYLFGSTMVYIDYTTLNKHDITYEDIASTGADVLIISCAYDPTMGWQFTDQEIEAIKRYVLEGHGLIATAGTFYYWVPNNNKLAPLFGLNEYTVWDVTGTDLLHLINVTHPMFAKVPNPLVFPKVGTAVPSDGAWDSNELTDGVYLARGHYRESAIVARRGLVYISPWLEVIPPHYRHHLQLLYNAILWSRYQKPQHELLVSLEAPQITKPKQTILLNATVYNYGLNDETGVWLKLLINGEEAASETIPILHVGESFTLSYYWRPESGLYNVTAYTPPLPFEEFIDNNIVSVEVAIGYWTSIYITEDNWPVPPDYDLDSPIFNVDPRHPIEWMHEYAGPPQILKGTLQIMAWDVDLPYEIDEVYFNGHYVGKLAGGPDLWAVSEFSIPGSYIQTGPNIVEVQVDKHFIGWYATAVDWANLTVVYIPYNHDLAVHLEAPKIARQGSPTRLNLTVYNFGLNDEFEVEAQLYINGTVYSEFIPKIEAGKSIKISFHWTPPIEGLYNLTAYIPPKPGEEFLLNNLETIMVYVIPPLKVAVLGDFYSQLTSLLKSYAITAEERGWDVIGDISTYNVVIVNRPDDPGRHVFLAFLSAADKNRVGLIFTSSWPGSNAPYGISLLEWYLGDPMGQGCTFGFGPVYYQVLAVHPILEGWNLGEAVHAITGGDRDFSWFWGYSGVTIANIGAEGIGVQGAGIAYKIRETGNKHVLLAGLAPQRWTNVLHWTENAKLILFRSVVWAGKPYVRNIAVTNVKISSHKAAVGESVNVTVDVGNLGNYFTETFQVDVYASPSNISLGSLQRTSDIKSAIVIWPGVNVMWIEPPMLAFNPSITPVGCRFNVTIYVSLNVSSYAWQMYLTYNKNHLNAIGCWYSAGAKSQWAGIQPTVPIEPYYGGHNATHNCVVFGECLIGMAETPPGTYSLAIVEFEIVKAPPPGQIFESQIRLDVEGVLRSYVLDPDLNEIPLTFMEATYRYGEVLPPPPPPPQGAIKIGTFIVSSLPPGGMDSRTITWNTLGVRAGNYTVWAVAQSLPGELSVEDNRFVDGSILLVSPPKANFTYSPMYPLPNETVLFDASHSSPNGGVIESYVWDFGDGQMLTTSEPTATHRYFESGTYNVTLKVIDSEGLAGSCWKTVYVCLRDISIVDVTVSTDRAYAGQKVAINVTVLNKGERAEIFELWLYYDMEAGSLIEVRRVSLNPGEPKVLTFNWDTAGVQPCRSYVVTAYALPLLGERNLDDNRVDCLTAVKIKMFGDVNGDGKIDMKDVAVVSRAFGSIYGHPGWNADADLNGDYKVDLKDVAAVSKRFGSVCC